MNEHNKTYGFRKIQRTVPKEIQKKLANQYMEKKGLNMRGLHLNEDSSSSEEGEAACQCQHIHDPLNCSAILELRPKWKYRINLDRSRSKETMTNEDQLELIKSEGSQVSLNKSLPQMKYSNSTKNISNQPPIQIFSKENYDRIK